MITFGIGHGGVDAKGVHDGSSAFTNGQRAFLHAMAGSVSAEIDGGKFGHGFVSFF